MKRGCTLLTGALLIVALAGCKNTLNSVGDTAEGAVHGTGTIVKGVGEGVGSIGEGVGKDLSSDKDAKKADNANESTE